MKALDLLAGRKIDHTFYPVVYGLTMRMTGMMKPTGIKQIPHWGRPFRSSVSGMHIRKHWITRQENVFKRLRLNMWVSSLTQFLSRNTSMTSAISQSIWKHLKAVTVMEDWTCPALETSRLLC